MHLTQDSKSSTISAMRVLVAAIASLIGNIVFQMSVDAGYIRHFTSAIPWLWGLCAALWIAWLITHDKIVKQWLKELHERLGRGIQPIRVAVCLLVFLGVSLGLRALIKPAPQIAAAPVAPTPTATPASPQPETPRSMSIQKPPQKPFPAKPSQDNSVHLNGSKIEQQSSGDCSPNIVGGSPTVNCGPPPPPPLQITWIARDMAPSEGFKYAKEVTVEVNVSYTPVSIGVVCDNPVDKIDQNLKKGEIATNIYVGLRDDHKAGYVYFESAAMAPGNPLFIWLKSNNPFSVTTVGFAKIKGVNF
jgi:hypothetical protein